MYLTFCIAFAWYENKQIKKPTIIIIEKNVIIAGESLKKKFIRKYSVFNIILAPFYYV